jgi:hypothetical protein
MEASVERPIDLPEGFEVFVPTEEKIEKLKQYYHAVQEPLRIAGSEGSFVLSFLDPGFVWFEIDGGKGYLGIQRFATAAFAQLHYMSGNGKISKSMVDRFTQFLIATFERVAWVRLSACLPSIAPDSLRQTLMLLGFKYEGTLRKAVELCDGRYCDQLIYSLLREEALAEKGV